MGTLNLFFSAQTATILHYHLPSLAFLLPRLCALIHAQPDCYSRWLDNSLKFNSENTDD